MATILQILPELEGDEMVFIQGLIKDMDDEQARMFAGVYRSRRRDPMVIVLTACLGFFGVAGIQRFLLGQIGMGLLYLFTWGICWIGTIVDLVSFKKLAFEHNVRIAQQVAVMIKGVS
ncbi:MAG: TM2 domain-containing protein [bacterium]